MLKLLFIKSINLQAILKHVGCFFILCLVVLCLASDVSAEDASGNGVYHLGSGDKLRVTVYGEKDLSGEFEVDGSGMVSLPLIGEIKVAGLTLRELEGAVETALKDGYLVDPQVSVEVFNYRPFYILGEVKNPGKYPYISGITVLNAVAMAGGYTYRARKSRAEIRREGHTESMIVTTPDVSPVLPGDIIRIPERYF